jgi:hypothetical protein
MNETIQNNMKEKYQVKKDQKYDSRGNYHLR